MDVYMSVLLLILVCFLCLIALFLLGLGQIPLFFLKLAVYALYALYYFLYGLCLFVFVGIPAFISWLIICASKFFRGLIQFFRRPIQKAFYFISRKGGALLNTGGALLNIGGALLKKRAQRLALQRLKKRRILLIRKLETQTPGPPSSPFRLQGLDGSSSAAQILGRETIPESAREDVARLAEIENEIAELEAQRRSAHS